ncbi:hypothetical protein HDU96_004532, partial [Phlyctochytrium bullatum]
GVAAYIPSRDDGGGGRGGKRAARKSVCTVAAPPVARAAKASAKAKKAAPKRRGQNWSPEELQLMFKGIESILPRGGNQWHDVESKYNLELSSLLNAATRRYDVRNAEALKSKFRKLHRMKKPTGKSQIPWDVEEAKRLRLEIEKKAGVLNLGDAEGGALYWHRVQCGVGGSFQPHVFTLFL